MIETIIFGTIATVISVIGVAWRLSARLTEQDVTQKFFFSRVTERLTRIEKHLKLNGGDDG